MDEQPDIVSSGPRRGHGVRWPGPGRCGWIAIGLLAVLLACLGVITSLALQVAHQHDTIDGLHAALQRAGQPAPATAALPTVSDAAVYTLPDAGDGSFSVVAVAVRPRPASAARIWLFVYARHARPGQRYGLLEDTCGGQYITQQDLADGTADQDGNLAIVAPDLAISNQAGDWIQVYRWADGTSLGGIQGPLTGRGATTFRSVPAC
jgi:hypothetical protein